MTEQAKPARDMTQRQFLDAVKRNGFRLVLGWLEDTTGQTSTSYGCTFSTKPVKLLRRQSLAKAIQARNRAVKAKAVTVTL